MITNPDTPDQDEPATITYPVTRYGTPIGTIQVRPRPDGSGVFYMATTHEPEVIRTFHHEKAARAFLMRYAMDAMKRHKALQVGEANRNHVPLGNRGQHRRKFTRSEAVQNHRRGGKREADAHLPRHETSVWIHPLPPACEPYMVGEAYLGVIQHMPRGEAVAHPDDYAFPKLCRDDKAARQWLRTRRPGARTNHPWSRGIELDEVTAAKLAIIERRRGLSEQELDWEQEHEDELIHLHKTNQPYPDDED